MDSRIVYNRNQMLLALENALEGLKPLRYDSLYRRCLGEGFVDGVARWDSEIRRRREEPLTLVVTGEFKRGKSSFINALLGEDVATTDVTTETVTLNRISYGAHENFAVLSGGRRLRLEDSELRRDALQAVLDRLDEPVTELELKRPCEILKNITIIDTPGTDDALTDFGDVVKQSLLNADVVVYVYNVLYPLSRSEQLFLRSAVLPQKFTTLYIVGSFTDTLETPANCDRVRNVIHDRLNALMPEVETWMLSPLDERCRQLGKRRPCPELTERLEAQFDSLRSAIEDLYRQKADTVVVDRMQRLTDAMVSALASELDTIEEGLSMSDEEAAKSQQKMKDVLEESTSRLGDLTAQIKSSVDNMKAEAQGWMADFVERIARETANLKEQSSDALFKYYECYCLDLLQQALKVCMDTHRERLYDELDAISGDLTEKLAGASAAPRAYSFRISVDNRIWTKGDTAGLVISQFGSGKFLGAVAQLAAEGLAGGLRGKEKQTRKPEIIAQISRQMTDLNISAQETVARLYDDLSAKAVGLLTDDYRDRLEKAQERIRHASSLAAQSSEDKEHTRAAVLDARRMLEKVDAAVGRQAPQMT